MDQLEQLLDGLGFPEEPRWHDGRLWLSDAGAGEVLALEADGRVARRVPVGGRCSGLAWMADDRLAIVDVEHRALLATAPRGDEPLEALADLRETAVGAPNGAAAGPGGRIYVGTVGFDLHADEPRRPGAILAVSPDGTVEVANDGELWFPNGMAMSSDGRRLLVAESFAARISAFEIAADGSLGGRQTWAELPEGTFPDGLCVDEAGAVWVADAAARSALRVAEGGRLLGSRQAPQRVFACALGGPARTTLYLMTAKTHRLEARAARTGVIFASAVDVPGVER